MGNRSRPLAAALAIVASVLALGAPTPARAAEPQVLMVDNEPDLTRWHYDPATVTVAAGTTVVWLNKGNEDHSVTADDKSFDSGLKKSGATFSRAFPRPGRYAYHCQPHPWMKGTVEVLAAPTAASAAAAPSSTVPPTTAAPTPATTAPAAPPDSTAPAAAPDSPTTAPGSGAESGEDEKRDTRAAASAPDDKGSGRNLPGTLALVLLPTLGALALGAKLRQNRS